MTADERMARMTLHAIYPLYLAKIEKKGRSKAELDEILQWITQLDADGVVRRNFLGPTTVAHLWAAVAEVRDPGSAPPACDHT